jgi:hypothetical protein
MDALQAVLALARENEDLKHQVSEYEEFMEKLVGASVTYTVKEGKKTKYHQCTVDSWNGDCWELIEEDPEDPDDPEVFEVTMDDFVEGRLWIAESS